MKIHDCSTSKNLPIVVKVCVIWLQLRCASEVVNGLLKIPLAVKAYSPGRGFGGVQGEIWVISFHFWGRHVVHLESRLHWIFEVKSLRGHRMWWDILAAVDTDRGYRARSRPVVVCKCAPPVELDSLAVIRNRPAKSPMLSALNL